MIFERSRASKWKRRDADEVASVFVGGNQPPVMDQAPTRRPHTPVVTLRSSADSGNRSRFSALIAQLTGWSDCTALAITTTVRILL